MASNHQNLEFLPFGLLLVPEWDPLTSNPQDTLINDLELLAFPAQPELSSHLLPFYRNLVLEGVYPGTHRALVMLDDFLPLMALPFLDLLALYGSYDPPSVPGGAQLVPSSRHRGLISEGIRLPLLRLPAPKAPLSKEDKIRRRREFHNAVERRRRDLIKEKIKELALLVPPEMLRAGPEGRDNKPNKTLILSKTVDYARHLMMTLEKQKHGLAALQKRAEWLATLPDSVGATTTATGSVQPMALFALEPHADDPFEVNNDFLVSLGLSHTEAPTHALTYASTGVLFGSGLTPDVHALPLDNEFDAFLPHIPSQATMLMQQESQRMAGVGKRELGGGDYWG